MRISLRFVLPLAVALTAIAYAVVPLVDSLTLKWFVRDLDIRANLIATAVQDPFVELLIERTRDKVRLQRVETFFNSILQDERLFALGFCDAAAALVYRTPTLPKDIACRPLDAPLETTGRVLRNERGTLHVSSNPIMVEGRRLGELLIVHDMSFIERRSADTKKYIFYLFSTIAAVVALLTVVIAELSWRGLIKGMKALISGERDAGAPEGTRMRELRPIARDLQALVRDLEVGAPQRATKARSPGVPTRCVRYSART